MQVTATELNKHSGKYINKAIKAPVIINRSGEPAAVLISYDFYEQLEDTIWGELAKEAEKKGKYLNDAETAKFLRKKK